MSMADLTREERTLVATEATNKRKKIALGWPESIQKENVPESYLEATLEWERRMMNSSSRYKL